MELIPTIAITRDGIHKKSIPAIAITRDGILHRPVTRLIKKIETDITHANACPVQMYISKLNTHTGELWRYSGRQLDNVLEVCILSLPASLPPSCLPAARLV